MEIKKIKDIWQEIIPNCSRENLTEKIKALKKEKNLYLFQIETLPGRWIIWVIETF